MTESRARLPIQLIVSGGQTGVDRAALDAAIARGVPHGGWCPKGRAAEDGTIAEGYRLRESKSAVPAERTRRNVLDSDATLILCRGKLFGGTLLTRDLAERIGRPFLVVDLLQSPDPEHVRAWIQSRAIRVLNVAGPRESGAPGIGAQARAFMEAVLEGR